MPAPTTSSTDGGPEHAAAGPGGARREALASLATAVALVVAIVGFAALSVVRDVRSNLSADGVQQSIMAVQNVDLFYWGQNRLAALPSWLTSGIGDPSVNLWACLLVNAAAFYAMLATLSWLGVRAVTGRASWPMTLVTFIVMVAVVRLMFDSLTRYVLSLEGQPYSTSHLFVLWAFLLWRRRHWLAWAGATVLVWLAVGVNPAAVLVLALLALVQVVRERTMGNFLRWALLGVICVATQASWMLLGTQFAGTPGPFPEPRLPYYEFTLTTLQSSWRMALDEAMGSLRLSWLAVVPVSAVAALSMPDEWRRRLRAILLPCAAFAVGYALLFASNGWVAMNGSAVRYFAPVLIVSVLCIGAPIAAWVVGSLRLYGSPSDARPGVSAASRRVPAHRRPTRRSRWFVVPGLALALTAAFAGPVHSPNQADVLQAVQPTADYSLDHDIRFISGWYWVMFPMLHDSLDGGRHELYVAAYKSGGDLADYQQAFTEQLDERGSVRALCVDWATQECADFLTYWTAPGWRDSGETCPVPPAWVGRPDWNLLHDPPIVDCRVMIHDDPDAPLTDR